MTQQIAGMVKERLINCSTHFDNDQIEAIMKVLEQSGFIDMYEALKALLLNSEFGEHESQKLGLPRMIEVRETASQALDKAEGIYRP